MGSKWMAAATAKDDMHSSGGKGSFRHIAKKNQDHGEPDADDEQPQEKKKKKNIVAAMNEPEMY